MEEHLCAKYKQNNQNWRTVKFAQNANVTVKLQKNSICASQKQDNFKEEKLICARCKRSNQNERYSCARDERNKQSKERLNYTKYNEMIRTREQLNLREIQTLQ